MKTESLHNSVNSPKKILLLGSGGLSIGQAGEFDYSGTQAIKSFVEEGFEVLLVNPNIATVQTNPREGVKVFLCPVAPETVEKIIRDERPEAIVGGFGGQTAIQCLIELDEKGILKEFNVSVLGSNVDTMKTTEDRHLFASLMKDIEEPVLQSVACETMVDARLAANQIGYPVIVRAGFALGGQGSGFANEDSELDELVETALASSPHILVEKSLKGWKEIEYEVMRDAHGNLIAICNMENFDPLGIHTGDSIVVCPSQTLDDDDFQTLRNSALKIAEACQVIGECNVQFALSPSSREYFVIEVNARLSRSSALASKASGYPIAYIAAKVVLGNSLLDLKNPVTGITVALYEPALDYVTIKIPKWDFAKFPAVSRVLGSTMKSVGEVMGIGRSFNEALQKAVRMVTEDELGVHSIVLLNELSDSELELALEQATDLRLYVVFELLRRGYKTESLNRISAIDLWFLENISRLVELEANLTEISANIVKTDAGEFAHQNLEQILNLQILRELKTNGYSDSQIALILGGRHVSGTDLVSVNSLIVRGYRKRLGLVPHVKKIDTTAAEFPSPSNYLYFSYCTEHSDTLPKLKGQSILVLGSGAYRIGSSVEFDWCAVSCSKALRSEKWSSILLNCNPETVSTDYDSSDRLYFDEITVERIMDIADADQPFGTIVCMGGQLPNKLAARLDQGGVRVIGHSAETIEIAENRDEFSSLLDQLEIAQPRWVNALSLADAEELIKETGFPVIVRPSFVLSGAAMKVAYDTNSLKESFKQAHLAAAGKPIVVSEFVEGAREIELDGVALNGEIVAAIVSEHVENAGVHSGDATTVVPAQNLRVETVRRVRKASRLIAAALDLHGPFNIQFLAKHHQISVIECNARASRSFPFVSKVIGTDLVELATKVILGRPVPPMDLREDDLEHVGVKAAMFSFSRLSGADPVLGVEMASTGEVACLGRNYDEALIFAMQSSGCRVPEIGVLVSSGSLEEKFKFLEAAEIFKKLGIRIYATSGSARFLKENQISCEELAWPGEAEYDCISAIKDKSVDLVINIPKSLDRDELSHDTQIRIAAAQYGCSLLTNMEKTIAFANSISSKVPATNNLLALPAYNNLIVG